MQSTRTMQRLGGLGVLYAVLFAAANVLLGNGAKTGSTGAVVVNYYHSHRARELAGVFVAAGAVIAFMFFLAALRRRLDIAGHGRTLHSLVLAGGAIYSTGLLLMGAMTVGLIDAAHYKMESTAQALNVLSQDIWLPVVVGLSLVALATGISALRTSALPGWLACASIGLGILALAGPLGGVAFLLAAPWGLVTGIVLMRSPVAEETASVNDAGRQVPAGI